jgi:hypothetical protein
MAAYIFFVRLAVTIIVLVATGIFGFWIFLNIAIGAPPDGVGFVNFVFPLAVVGLLAAGACLFLAFICYIWEAEWWKENSDS